MTKTSKILIGVGGVGLAGFMLWRLWPQEETPPEETPPEEPMYFPSTVPDRSVKIKHRRRQRTDIHTFVEPF